MTYSRRAADMIVADSFEGLGHRHKRALLRAVDPDDAGHIKYEQFLIKSLGDGVYNKVKRALFDGAYREKVLLGLEKSGVSCVALGEGGYPSLLAEIPAPPLVIYCRGNIDLLSGDCFTVVGSRRTPAATAAACNRIAGELTEHFTVVSGVADGADTAAVRGALPSGKVICVLPGGHQSVASSANAALIKSVEEGGLVISESPPQRAVLRYMYVARNRILAGLSKGTLVVSAGIRSGALITAGYAADYGREVFAFPHSLGVSSGEGCNQLIKNGASLCRNVLDILSEFGLEYQVKRVALTPAEEKVLAYLRANGGSHIQAVASAVGIKVYEAVTVLSSLEIKGLVARSGGNSYSAV